MWLLLSRETIGLGNYQLHYTQHNHQGVQNPRGNLTASRDSKSDSEAHYRFPSQCPSGSHARAGAWSSPTDSGAHYRFPSQCPDGTGRPGHMRGRGHGRPPQPPCPARPITASQASARTVWDVRVTCEGEGMVVPH